MKDGCVQADARSRQMIVCYSVIVVDLSLLEAGLNFLFAQSVYYQLVAK